MGNRFRQNQESAMSAYISPIFSLRKKWLWLASLLPLLFISDILYGGLNYYGIKLPISPGILFRGAVLLIAVYMVMIYSRLVGQQLLMWIVLMILSVIPSLVVGIFHSQSMLFELAALSKALYLPFVTSLFVVLILRYRIEYDEILRFIEFAAYILGISLLLSQVLGIQSESYGDYAFGSKGIFYAGNDVTLALGLALMAASYRLVIVHFSFVRLLLLGMSAFACVQIGARASLGIVIGTAFASVACAIWGRMSEKNGQAIMRMKKWIASTFILVAMAGMLLYGLTKQQEFNFQQQKLEQITAGDLPRLLLMQAGNRHIIERSEWLHLTGEGTDAFQRGVANYYPGYEDRKAIEVDWMDIFGSYGIGFTLLIHAFVLLVLIGSARLFLIKRDAKNGLIAAATLLYLGHSAFAGHALTSPISTTLIAGYFALFFTNKFIINKFTIARRRT